MMVKEYFNTMTNCKFAGEQRPEKRMKTQGENVHMTRCFFLFYILLMHFLFLSCWIVFSHLSFLRRHLTLVLCLFESFDMVVLLAHGMSIAVLYVWSLFCILFVLLWFHNRPGVQQGLLQQTTCLNGQTYKLRWLTLPNQTAALWQYPWLTTST